MKTISECRLNAYQLFFEKPLCQYSSFHTQKVLIAGNGIQAEEAFKISLIAGQNLGKDLLIDFFSNCAEEFGKMLFDENGSFPALCKFVNNKNTDIQFKNSDLSLIEVYDYDYIILADDNEKTNLETVHCILTASTFERKPLIAVYCDSKDAISLQTDDAEIYVFGNQNIDSFKNSELMRLAKNINFAYAMDYNQNKSCETADSEFMESFEKEFISSENNFHGANYDADSSIACAMHIPYKLEFCKQFGESDDAENILSESIIHKNRVYENLVELEHKRWNVFMALRGFRAPKKDELKIEADCFHNGRNDHKNKEKLLHMCMVEFDKLDKVSKQSTKLATERSKKITKNEIINSLHLEIRDEQNLKYAIDKLFNDDANSVKLYEDALKSVKGIITDDKIKYIESRLSPVVTRNKKIDFKGIDEQLIDFMPFCLWYRKKYKKIITISDKVALQDVIIPTIFCSKNLLFLGKDIKHNNEYAERINNYFNKRFGDNYIKPKFEYCDEHSLVEMLENEIKKNGKENILINVSGTKNPAIILALGKIMAASAEITIVSYDKAITVLNGDRNISAGINNKYFTAEEVIRLTGGEPVNEYNMILSSSQREGIGKFFEKYYTFKSYNVIGENSKPIKVSFNPWILMSDIFKQILSSEKLTINLDDTKIDYSACATGKLVFEKEVYLKSGIKKVLEACCKKRIIQALVQTEEGEDVRVTFEYLKDEELLFDTFKSFAKSADFLQTESTEEDIVRTRNKMHRRININKDGIHTYNLYINKPINKKSNKEVKLYTNNEHKTIQKCKEEFMRDLEKTGFIQLMATDDLQSFNFVVKNEHIRWALMTQGAIWEQLVLHKLCLYSRLSDLKLGVHFSWDKNVRNFDKNVEQKISRLPEGKFGYTAYLKCVAAVKKDHENDIFYGIENEIDVIAVSKMDSYFISCKTNKNDDKNWLYEIKSISGHFNAVPIMATAHNYDKSDKTEFINRAFQMGIPLIGMETVCDEERLKIALNDISEGKIINPIVKGKETYVYEL